MSTATEQAPTSAGGNRWLILAGGVLVQLAIGAVYAWSTFSKAIQADPSALELTKVQATIPFEVAIGMIFVGTFLGGRIQDKQGPRLVALVGVTIYSIGIILASFARDASDLWLLVLGYGVLGGFGLGLAYIVPIAMLQKWFPDKRGLITGLAVGGFGFGAVIGPTTLLTKLGDRSTALATWGMVWIPDEPVPTTATRFPVKSTGRCGQRPVWNHSPANSSSPRTCGCLTDDRLPVAMTT